MLTPISQEDDRRRGSNGLLLSVAQKADGTLRLSVDCVASDSATLPNNWNFKVFNGHFEIDEGYIQLIENEVSKPESEQSEYGIGVPDSVLKEIGHALLTSLVTAAIEARKVGPI